MLEHILMIYLIAVNLTAFIVYGIDKLKAVKGKWRISERTLLLFAVFGGSAGALAGMFLFRHKTQKAKFTILVPCVLTVQILLGMWLIKCFL